jgi:HK97 family phage major capsid protein
MEGLNEIKTAVGELSTAMANKIKALETENDGLRERIEIMESKADIPRGSSRAGAEAKSFIDYIKGDKTALRETKEMSIAGGAASGQAAVPEIIADQILEQALKQSQITKKVRRTQVSSSDYVRLVNLRGQAAAWSSETGSRSATNTFEFRECRPTHGELYSVVTVSNWLMNDAKFDLKAMIMSNASAQFAKALDAAVYNGNGSNKPTGIFYNAPSSSDDFSSPLRAANKIEYISGSADHANDIISLFFALAPEYRGNATFAMSSAILSGIRQLRDENGSGFLWQQNLSSAMDAPDGLLMGRPVVTWEDMTYTYPSSPQGYPILCGDFSAGYELIEIGPMSVIVDQVTTKGKTLIYLYQRFGGIITDNNALKCIKG